MTPLIPANAGTQMGWLEGGLKELSTLPISIGGL
jgi:hypothetical protein